MPFLPDTVVQFYKAYITTYVRLIIKKKQQNNDTINPMQLVFHKAQNQFTFYFSVIYIHSRLRSVYGVYFTKLRKELNLFQLCAKPFVRVQINSDCSPVILGVFLAMYVPQL